MRKHIAKPPKIATSSKVKKNKIEVCAKLLKRSQFSGDWFIFFQKEQS
jgi:hypothetical protein